MKCCFEKNENFEVHNHKNLATSLNHWREKKKSPQSTNHNQTKTHPQDQPSQPNWHPATT